MCRQWSIRRRRPSIACSCFPGSTSGCRTAAEQRDTAEAGVAAQLPKFVRTPGCKQIGERLLVGGQDVDGEVVGGGKGLEASRGLVQRPQHHRRVEGQGVETVRGESDRRPVRSPDGHDRDARGEGAERGAELAGVE